MHHVSLSSTTQVRSLMGLRRVVCGALVLLCGHDPSQQALNSPDRVLRNRLSWAWEREDSGFNPVHSVKSKQDVASLGRICQLLTPFEGSTAKDPLCLKNTARIDQLNWKHCHQNPLGTH